MFSLLTVFISHWAVGCKLFSKHSSCWLRDRAVHGHQMDSEGSHDLQDHISSDWWSWVLTAYLILLCVFHIFLYIHKGQWYTCGRHKRITSGHNKVHLSPLSFTTALLYSAQNYPHHHPQHTHMCTHAHVHTCIHIYILMHTHTHTHDKILEGCTNHC